MVPLAVEGIPYRAPVTKIMGYWAMFYMVGNLLFK